MPMRAYLLMVHGSWTRAKIILLLEASPIATNVENLHQKLPSTRSCSIDSRMGRCWRIEMSKTIFPFMPDRKWFRRAGRSKKGMRSSPEETAENAHVRRQNLGYYFTDEERLELEVLQSGASTPVTEISDGPSATSSRETRPRSFVLAMAPRPIIKTGERSDRKEKTFTVRFVISDTERIPRRQSEENRWGLKKCTKICDSALCRLIVCMVFGILLPCSLVYLGVLYFYDSKWRRRRRECKNTTTC